MLTASDGTPGRREGVGTPSSLPAAPPNKRREVSVYI